LLKRHLKNTARKILQIKAGPVESMSLHHNPKKIAQNQTSVDLNLKTQATETNLLHTSLSYYAEDSLNY